MEIEYQPNPDDYDAAWALHNLCFTQHRAWGDVKNENYEPRFMIADQVALGIYQRRLPGVGGYFGYAPRALNNSLMQPADWLRGVCQKVADDLKLSHIIIEPNAELREAAAIGNFLSAGFRINENTIQPHYSRLIDLTKSDDELFATMDKDVRRRIQRAADSGYQFIEQTTPAGLDAFYDGLAAVAKRAKFDIQPKSYFAQIMDSFKETGMVRIYLCSAQTGELLYALFTITDNGTFRRIYGGPTTAGREGDAAQYTAWEAIRAAKALSAHTLDLWGVAPYRETGYASHHPLSSVSKFKASLGGRNITYYPQLIWVHDKARFAAYHAMAKTHRRLTKLRRLFR